MSPTPPHETGPQETRPVVLAVVGVGPTASSFLERLMASVPELLDDTPLVVHLIDPHRAGTGRIWRSDQSHLLWMNSMAEDVTMFTDATVMVPSAYVALAAMESVTVSVPSTSASSIGVTASATLLCPAGMTVLVPSET